MNKLLFGKTRGDNSFDQEFFLALNLKTVVWGQGLIHCFISTTAAGKGFGLGFKCKAHPKDIAHRFF